MSAFFSEDSVLLIKNWEAVQDILIANNNLRKELGKFLSSLGVDLRRQAWWQENWVFMKSGESQAYISRRNWRSNNEYLVWIGLEGFVPENIFGDESNADLYIWVSGKRHKLARMLAEELDKGNNVLFGQVNPGEKTGYIVKQFLAKCLPEDIDKFESIFRKQIVDFMTHYARVLNACDQIIMANTE